MMRRCKSNLVLAATLMTVSTLGVVLGQNNSHRQISHGPVLRQYVVVLKHGPKWIQGKTAVEQPLLPHGKYLKELMDKGSLQIAGPFLDDSGGLILLNADDESAARQIVENDPGVRDQILEPEIIRPFRIAFDAATGLSPFGKE